MGADTFVNTSVGNRSTKRARVLLAAKLQTPFGEVEGRLRDLSRKGALIECAKVPPVGTEVTFVRGATIVPARVAWTGTNRVGLEFHCMIDEHEVLVHIGKAGAGGSRDRDRFRRPSLNAGMSPEERKLAESWGVAVGITLPDHEA